MDAPGTQFVAIRWINSYFCTDLPFSRMKPVLYFSLIWSMFEKDACDCNAHRGSIRSSVDRANQTGRLRRERYLELLRYFQERAVTTEQNVRSYLDTLFPDHPEPKVRKAIRVVLQGEAHELKDTVYALLLIAYRIRNNLFHGNKAVPELPPQTDLFVEVNWLLATYLEDLLDLPIEER